MRPSRTGRAPTEVIIFVYSLGPNVHLLQVGVSGGGQKAQIQVDDGPTTELNCGHGICSVQGDKAEAVLAAMLKGSRVTVHVQDGSSTSQRHVFLLSGFGAMIAAAKAKQGRN